MEPCPNEPFCKGRLVPTEEHRCKKCGLAEDGSRPCLTPPYCAGRRISAIDGVDLVACEPCGDEGQPPCLDEDTGRAKKGITACKKGLRRTSVAVGDERVRVAGQESFCTAEQLPTGCGYVGQETCDGVCKGRSTASEDGQMCVECGGPGQGTCDGPNQVLCDEKLEVFEQDNLAPICLCPEDGCNDCLDGGVMDQSGPGDGGDSSVPCGGQGDAVCPEEPYCDKRTLPDEDGTCTPCGDEDGSLPCTEDDLPRCGYRLALVGDFCKSCGGLDQPVCCDRQQCDKSDPTNTACDAGLFRTGTQLVTFSIKNQASEAFCSDVDTGNLCGLIDQPPCVIDKEAAANGQRPCLNLATPDLAGTKCVRCGKEGDPACEEREQGLCTGNLVELYDEFGTPATCFNPKSTADDTKADDTKADRVKDQSAGAEDCGMPNMAWCVGTPTPCIGRSIPVAGNVCAPCGGPAQVACSSGPPCDDNLRSYKRKCVECGGDGQAVCPLARMGPPCNEGLEAVGAHCEAGAGATQPDGEVLNQSATPEQLNPTAPCGLENDIPCAGQPACGEGFYLVIYQGKLKCSSVRPGEL